MELYAAFYTHDNRGNDIGNPGRAIHIIDLESEKILCGLSQETRLVHLGAEADLDWVLQPDPDKSMCQKCKKKALKLYIKEFNNENNPT